MHELERWNCCGAVFSLASDDLIHQLAPTRVLIRALQAGSDRIVTLCSQCYNTLARANRLVREDEEKRHTLNEFMTEEPDYHGEVEVIHLLTLLRDEIGWDALREKVSKPLDGLKVAPFYGCTLLRPRDVGIDDPNGPTILKELIAALGATPADFPLSTECCGAYQVVGHPEAGRERSQKVVESALRNEVDALILSCPLCEYNVGQQQKEFVSTNGDPVRLPVFYFSQLLALALGLDVDTCRFELNAEGARALLEDRRILAAAGA